MPDVPVRYVVGPLHGAAAFGRWPAASRRTGVHQLYAWLGAKGANETDDARQRFHVLVVPESEIAQRPAPTRLNTRAFPANHARPTVPPDCPGAYNANLWGSGSDMPLHTESWIHTTALSAFLATVGTVSKHQVKSPKVRVADLTSCHVRYVFSGGGPNCFVRTVALNFSVRTNTGSSTEAVPRSCSKESFLPDSWRPCNRAR